MVKRLFKGLPALARNLVSGLKKNGKHDTSAENNDSAQNDFQVPPGEGLTIPRAEHCVSRKDICPYAKKVLYRLNRAGFTAYLVGGGVRDLLLGRNPKDFDVSTDAHPGQIKKLFRNCWLVGRRFRLAHIRFGNTIIETSTFRKRPPREEQVDLRKKSSDKDEDNGKRSKLLVTSDNTFGTPREDAFRRDFTINGLFYDINSFAVIDHVGGVRDLKERLIRSIGDAETRFHEDPVRMLRAVRFASRLDFNIEKSTYQAILTCAEEIGHAAPARLVEEVLRLFAFGSGAPAFRLLFETGLLKEVLPSVAEYLKNADKKEQDKFFSYLEKYDQYIKDTQGTPAASEALCALMYPILHSKIADRPEQPAAHLVRETADLLAERMVLPRRIVDRLKRIFIAMQRLDARTRRRFNKTRFMNSECFDFALRLYGFSVEIEKIAPERLERWIELYDSVKERNSNKKEAAEKEDNEQKTSTQPPAKKKSRKRRRRKPKSKDGQNPSQNNSDANAPQKQPEGETDDDSSAEKTKKTRKKAKKKRSKRTGGSSNIISRKRPGSEKPLVDNEAGTNESHHWLEEI